MDRIEAGLVLAGITGRGQLQAVMPIHSHFDHAMDVSEIANATGATVVGSKSTAYIALGGEVPKHQIDILSDHDMTQPFEHKRTYGEFTITFIESVHGPVPGSRGRRLGRTIDAPLKSPAHERDYKDGPNYAIHIKHKQRSALIHASAGFVPGVLDEHKADVLFLGIGGLGGQNDDYRADYWKHVVKAVKPSRIIPIHWDAFTRPISRPLRGLPTAPWHLNTNAIIRWLEAGQGEFSPRVELLPLAQPVALFPSEKTNTLQ